MTSRRRAALRALALVLGVVGAPASAAAFPSLDPTSETILVGPGVPVIDADRQGAWQSAPGRVAPTGGRRGVHHTWFPRVPALTDGFVRARLVARGGVEASLVLRGAPPDAARGEPTGAVSGYVVVVTPKEVRLELWELGKRRALLPAKKVKVGGGVEIVAWLIGPHLRVDVFDTTTLASLASFAVTDPQRPTGRVGLYATGAKADAQALVLLTLRPAKVEGSARDAPAGPERYVALPPASLARVRALPREVKGLYEVMETRADGHTVVRTTAEGHELLARDGVELAWLESDTPFKYIDRGWLAARARGVEATASGFRVDRSYKDHAQVEALLRAYHARFPALTRLVELGASPGGRTITAIVVSDHAERHEPDEPAVFLNGAHHGNELLPIELVLDALQTLLERYGEPEIRRLVDGLEIWLVPLVNPDGNHAFWHGSSLAGRKNARDTDGNGRFDPTDGVDLNRNYPFAWGALGEVGSRAFARAEYHRGPSPGSEPETRALMRLVDAIHPAASISYHTVSNVILVPYTTDGPTNPEPNEAWVIAEQIARALPVQPTGKRMGVAKKIYAVDGVDQDHFRAAHGTVALLVEGAYHNPLGGDLRRSTIGATRGTWLELFRRVLAGPSIVGRVRDASGRPVAAEVMLRELAPGNGERWTSRCRDGRFDRLLPGAGAFTLEVDAPGYLPWRRAVRADEGVTEVDVRLEALAGHAPGRACGDPALMSVDHLCACEAGECLEPGPPAWCRIDDRCVRAGEGGAGGRCDPVRDQHAWSP
ncbi:MAG: carboxypeptidase regulatory-like domain-containing protein [Deltaproteobacteria bacterium]|nr:carboxypeptidase regulatory-like domain-containing protein [Deltaproteobacteria bacterium]